MPPYRINLSPQATPDSRAQRPHERACRLREGERRRRRRRRSVLRQQVLRGDSDTGTNYIKIGLPGKLILSKRKGLPEDQLSKIVSENGFPGNTYFYTIASRVPLAAGAWCTPSRTLVGVGFIVGSSFVINLPHFFNYYPDKGLIVYSRARL